MARAVIYFWFFPDLMVTGIWCDTCLTSGGFRIPYLSSSGPGAGTGCTTCV